MTTDAALPTSVTCPFCRKGVPAEAKQCPHCNEWLYDADGRLRQRGDKVEPLDFLVPRRVSLSSMLACYLGLLGACVPFLGLAFAVPAIICGIVALRRRRKSATYGAVTSDIRAFIGIVLGALGIVLWSAMGFMVLADWYRRGHF
jgi:hypothetical protein